MNESNEKIGVYLCHCGVNISSVVDVEAVASAIGRRKDVGVARTYKFMCSNTGQEMIETDVKTLGLTRVVVAACSPLMHEPTFRNACERAGLNRYLFQMANVREHNSWVHDDKKAATEKAKMQVNAAVSRVALAEPLHPMRAAIHPATLVVGAGIGGIQAALELAETGHPVYLVEREASIGGKMLTFDKTFPTLDCAACILTPKMVSISQRPSIKLMTWSEVQKVSGYIGNFKIEVRKKARYVDTTKCTGCGQCWSHCPATRIPSRREIRLGDLVINCSETKARLGAKVIDVPVHEEAVEVAK
jgi:heterodisulfide reductase subunit A